ncbi:hypothetical protein KC321_g69 [Hortaea werneckii]|nr:hypothetical protein KC321_g69 [Hortaea werneckii]
MLDRRRSCSDLIIRIAVSRGAKEELWSFSCGNGDLRLIHGTIVLEQRCANTEERQMSDFTECVEAQEFVNFAKSSICKRSTSILLLVLSVAVPVTKSPLVDLSQKATSGSDVKTPQKKTKVVRNENERRAREKVTRSQNMTEAIHCKRLICILAYLSRPSGSLPLGRRASKRCLCRKCPAHTNLTSLAIMKWIRRSRPDRASR